MNPDFNTEGAEITEKTGMDISESAVTAAGTDDNSVGLTGTIIGAAIAAHRDLGPGLLESAYEACLAYELIDLGVPVQQQKELPVIYRGTKVDCGYRIDLLVAECVVVELKAVEKLLPIHKAQLLSYLRLSGCRVGLLISFNVRKLVDGAERVVNDRCLGA